METKYLTFNIYPKDNEIYHLVFDNKENKIYTEKIQQEMFNVFYTISSKKINDKVTITIPVYGRCVTMLDFVSIMIRFVNDSEYDKVDVEYNANKFNHEELVTINEIVNIETTVFDLSYTKALFSLFTIPYNFIKSYFIKTEKITPYEYYYTVAQSCDSELSKVTLDSSENIFDLKGLPFYFTTATLSYLFTTKMRSAYNRFDDKFKHEEMPIVLVDRIIKDNHTNKSFVIVKTRKMTFEEFQEIPENKKMRVKYNETQVVKIETNA